MFLNIRLTFDVFLFQAPFWVKMKKKFSIAYLSYKLLDQKLFLRTGLIFDIFCFSLFICKTMTGVSKTPVFTKPVQNFCRWRVQYFCGLYWTKNFTGIRKIVVWSTMILLTSFIYQVTKNIWVSPFPPIHDSSG